ncbi:hypothetical protein AVEN_206135-1 [Araneus ventricosus]|uniref:C2H2-type domain-containing protein n=1 Tax=Araneus ventricosus TaxID=182803 RepID=A0A4Y2W4X7_ARAVE|nr:hypothetical protein AVEN_206135-1 [Araneus ventricosus]
MLSQNQLGAAVALGKGPGLGGGGLQARNPINFIKDLSCRCGCCFKKKQPKEFYFDDVNVEPSTSGYPYIDYPIFEGDLNGKANNGRNFLASGDYMNGGKKWNRNRRRYKCGTCSYKSTTKKGLRWHMITAHKKDVQSKRTVDAYGRPLNFFGDILEKTQNEQKYQGEIYDGDDDFDKQMKWAISESIFMAAAR